MNNKIKIGVIITNKKGHVLLIKEKIQKNDKALWNIIKGTYGDHKNEDVFQASKRECLEEIGVDIEINEFQGCYIAQINTTNYTMLIFNAQIKQGKPQLKSQAEQITRNEDIREFKWFSKQEILNMKKNEFISNRIHFIINDWIQNKKSSINYIKQIQ
jgi:ADP-ribose pyrophosphatase YjhB (NUDIX family)